MSQRISCPSCGIPVVDCRRARTVHYNSSPECLQALLEQETRGSQEMEASNSSLLMDQSQQSHTSQNSSDEFMHSSQLLHSPTSQHSFPPADEADSLLHPHSPNSQHSGTNADEADSVLSDLSSASHQLHQPMYFESDPELDSDTETNTGSDSSSDPLREYDDEDPEAAVFDDYEDTDIDPKYLAQLRLDSFLNQPSPREALPEDLDLTYRILDALQSCGAPLSCFESIVELTRRAHRLQVPLQPVSRQKAMKDMRERFHQDELAPIQTELHLPSGLTAAITTFDFCAALGSLLSDPELMKDEHLLLYEKENGEAMGQPSEVPPEELTDILDGDVCREAYRLYVKKKDSDLLVPIIMFIDKTHVDTNGRLTLEPLCFTLGIFKKEYRRQPEFWRTLGFVNTSRDNVELNPEQKLADYHYVLSHILQSYKDAQRMDLRWKIHYRGKDHDVSLQIPLLYVVGDTEGHDKLCAHYQNRTKSASLCRYCKCPREDTGNPNVRYKKTCASEIANLVRRGKMDQLKKRSYHAVVNAFNGILFCDPVRGINGATPGELLHVIQHGLDNYFHTALLNAKKERATQTSRSQKRKQTTSNPNAEASNVKESAEEVQNVEESEAQVASDASYPPGVEAHAPNYMGDFQQPSNKSEMKVMPNSVLKKVDAAAKKYGQWLVHQSDREYHRAYFKDGISSTASKQGHEERMVLLLFLILFSSSMFSFFKNAFGSEQRLSLYVLVLSHFIMLEDFMKRDRISRSDLELLQKYMPKFMEMFKRATDREEGMGMNIIKFHLLLHLAEDIQRFGPCTGFDSSFCESMHKLYKLDAQRTQKRTDDSFQYQTAKRSCERIAIACGMRSIRMKDARNRIPRAVSPTVRTYGSGTLVPRNAIQRTIGDGPHLPANEWKYMKKVQTNRDLRMCSVADVRGNLYRADWRVGRYDWAYVEWEGWGKVVARFKCFFDLDLGESCPCVHTDSSFDGPGCFALVEAFTQDYTQAPPEDDSIYNFQAHTASSLLYRMELARDACNVPLLYIVDLEKMVLGPAAVVPYDSSHQDPVEWLVIAPKWERMSIFRENMSELIKESRKRK